MPGRPSAKLSEFGELIERLREKIPRGRRPGVNEIGDRIGVSRSRWHRVRTGLADLRRHELVRLAEALEVSIDHLLETDEPTAADASEVSAAVSPDNVSGFARTMERMVSLLATAYEEGSLSPGTVALGLNWMDFAAQIERAPLPTAYWQFRQEISHPALGNLPREAVPIVPSKQRSIKDL